MAMDAAMKMVTVVALLKATEEVLVMVDVAAMFAPHPQKTLTALNSSSATTH